MQYTTPSWESTLEVPSLRHSVPFVSRLILIPYSICFTLEPDWGTFSRPRIQCDVATGWNFCPPTQKAGVRSVNNRSEVSPLIPFWRFPRGRDPFHQVGSTRSTKLVPPNLFQCRHLTITVTSVYWHGRPFPLDRTRGVTDDVMSKSL